MYDRWILEVKEGIRDGAKLLSYFNYILNIKKDRVIEMKKMLVIGNGFDLAHKLKTSYKDFG